MLLTSLLLAFAFAPSSPGEEVAIAKNAKQELVQNGWQIVESSTIVPGTEKFRAQFFNRVFYCGKLGAGKARVIWEERATGTHFHPLRIAPDGTVFANVYSNKLLIIGPDDLPGKQGDGTAIVLPNQKAKTETVILHTSAAGLIVHPNDLNKEVPIYFVPLDGRKPLVEKTVELGTRNASEMWRSRTGFQVTDKWVVWDTSAFEVATGKIRKLVAESGTRHLLGVDGDLVLVERNATVDKKAVRELLPTDLKTGVPTGRYAMAHDSEFVVLHEGVAYVLHPIPLKSGETKQRAEIAAFDLAKPSDVFQKTVVPFQAKQRFQSREFLILVIGDKGFMIQNNFATEVKWAAREKK